MIAGYIRKNAADFQNLEFSEKAIEIALGDGVSVAGRIDLVRRIDTGEVTIVDLKSNDRAQAEAVTETQLHIYALGYQELTGRQCRLRRDLRARRAEAEAPFGGRRLHRRREARRPSRGRGAARATSCHRKPNKKTCGRCDYCNLCSAAIAN